MFSLWYKIDRDTNAKIDSLGELFAKQLTEAQKQGDEKRQVQWNKMDANKKEAENDITSLRKEVKDDTTSFRKEIFDGFVSVKWCTLIHDNADKVYADFKNTLENLGHKLDTLLERK